MQKLDSKATWYFYLQNLGGILAVVLLVLGINIFFNFLFSQAELEGTDGFVVSVVKWVVIIGGIIVLAIQYIIAKLRYHFYRYQLREDGFRKEHGIIYKKYVTIPYDRIQNVDIDRNLIARLMGLSDLKIHTAGETTAGSEGLLPGLSVEIAEQMRDELIRLSKRPTGQGL